MQINELFELTLWMNEKIKRPQVVNKYQQLLTVMQQNASARNNQPQQPFESQKNDVIQAIASISTSDLTNEQERMISNLNVPEYIGERGISLLEDILFRNSLDIATAASEINKTVQELNSAIQKLDQVNASLRPLINEEVLDSEESSDVVMRVHFQNDVALDNLSDFKRWGTTWYDIGRGIAMVHDSAPEDIKVIGAQKGSIIIELAVATAIATTASTIILSALKVADRVLTIRKKAEEIKALKLGNQKLEQEISKEADKEKKEGLESITKEITISLNIDQNGDGEKVKVLEKSIKNLIDFVEKGGEVDFFANEYAEEDDDTNQLKMNFQQIKVLEKRVLSIESKRS